MHIFISIVGIIITIFFVVGTHEAAHFFVAKLLGVKVLRFSIGFGKPLKIWHDKSGTEYVIAPIPLGGYVRMLDESEGIVPPKELAFAYNRQPFYKKYLIVAAGPACNLLCAFLLYWLIFVIGFTTVKPIIGTVTPHSIAQEAGLKPNQLIVGIDGKQTDSWTTILFRLLEHVGTHDHLRLQVADINGLQTHDALLDLNTWQLDELNPDPLTSLGIKPYEPHIPLVIGMIAAKSPAAKSALKVGDKILALNQQTVKSWDEVLTFIYQHPGESIQMRVERDGKSLIIPITLGMQRTLLLHKYGFIGIGPKFNWPTNMLSKIQYSPLAASARAWQEVKDLSYLNIILFGKMITGKLSLQSLGGPITIFDSAGDALNNGTLAFISFLAFLSIAIGIVNFLPIPGLDGGHLLLQLVEVVIRRPLPERVLNILFRLGFLFLFLILIQALVNDFMRAGVGG